MQAEKPERETEVERIEYAVWMLWRSSDTRYIQIKHYYELFSNQSRNLIGAVKTDIILNWAFKISKEKKKDCIR